MPLDKCALYNETKAAISVGLTEDLCLTFTYMSELRMYDQKASQDVFWQKVPDGPVLIEHSADGKLELHMYHGRDSADEDMEDWGFDGPKLQADIIVVHPDRLALYLTEEETVRFLPIHRDLLGYGGKFYGDFSVERAGETSNMVVPVLRQLQELLSAKEWDSDTVADVARVLNNAGYKVEDSADDTDSEQS